MKNKTIIRPHQFLLFGGRIFTLLCLCFAILILYVTIFMFNKIGVIGIILCVVLFPLMILLFWFLWPQIWGELLITDEYIIFFGLFLPIVKLKYEDIEYAVVRTFDKENVMYSNNLKSDAHKFILLSLFSIPNKRIDKIYTSRKKKIIKYAANLKLCEILVKNLPKHKSKEIEYLLFLFKRAK